MTAMAVSSPSQTCGLVLIAAVLLQTICVAVTILYFTNELQQLRDACSKSNLACLMEEDLALFPRTLEPWDTADREDVTDPCREATQQLSRIIKKILLKNNQADISSAVKGEISQMLPRIIDEKYGSNFPVLRTAAHVTGSNGKTSPEESNIFTDTFLRRGFGYKLRAWEPEKGLSLLSNIDLKNGELVIQKSGFYYVYSQTYFRYQEPENGWHSVGTKRVKQLVQYIYKFTSYYPEPILLMKSAKTTCWSKNAEYGLHSIYEGGVFELKHKDRIFVSVSDKNSVNMDNEASFFGAFLIS
ncbi:tumor necrosis factor ligand superfamily member 10 isoform X2 [Ambystoma mexicanum]|uniref:tumor necrosis factor ligand superfamily member 10 isoform X1 n=1 Tax=Ambystoma mexicanum TaxID=8296 RepID=UPI0037E9839F